MDFQALLEWARNLFARYPLYCSLAAAALLLLTLWKPAKMLKRAVLLLVLLVVLSLCFFLIDSMKTGVSIKEKAAQRTENLIEE